MELGLVLSLAKKYIVIYKQVFLFFSGSGHPLPEKYLRYREEKIWMIEYDFHQEVYEAQIPVHITYRDQPIFKTQT